MLKTLLLVVLGFVFIGCAHHRDVRPGADGTHRVRVMAEDEASGSKDALSQAKHFCKEQNKYAAITDEKSKYVGSMDESTYNNTKTASKVAKAVGGSAYVFGGKKEKNIGGLAMLGGTAADVAAGEGYMVEMKFKCQ